MDVSFQNEHGLPIPQIHLCQNKDGTFDVYRLTGHMGNYAVYEMTQIHRTEFLEFGLQEKSKVG